MSSRSPNIELLRENLIVTGFLNDYITSTRVHRSFRTIPKKDVAKEVAAAFRRLPFPMINLGGRVISGHPENAKIRGMRFLTDQEKMKRRASELVVTTKFYINAITELEDVIPIDVEPMLDSVIQNLSAGQKKGRVIVVAQLRMDCNARRAYMAVRGLASVFRGLKSVLVYDTCTSKALGVGSLVVAAGKEEAFVIDAYNGQRYNDNLHEELVAFSTYVEVCKSVPVNRMPVVSAPTTMVLGEDDGKKPREEYLGGVVDACRSLPTPLSSGAILQVAGISPLLTITPSAGVQAMFSAFMER